MHRVLSLMKTWMVRRVGLVRRSRPCEARCLGTIAHPQQAITRAAMAGHLHANPTKPDGVLELNSRTRTRWLEARDAVRRAHLHPMRMDNLA